jgi:hypothetical protein
MSALEYPRVPAEYSVVPAEYPWGTRRVLNMPAECTCSSSRGLLRTRRSISSSFRLFEYPLMPAALHFSIRSGTVVFLSISRSCSGVGVTAALPLPAASARCTQAL